MWWKEYLSDTPFILSCPNCSKKATFIGALRIKIIRKEDIPYFLSKKYFDYRFDDDLNRGQLDHYAVYFRELCGSMPAHLSDLPEKCWGSPTYDEGVLSCEHCFLKKKWFLDWPNDGYYRVEVKGKVLWAYTLDQFLAIRAYVASKDRKWEGQPWLDKVPSHFYSAKNREEVLKKIDRLVGKL